MSIESIIVNLSYLGILLLMITNGFISSPSSQFLYIIAGYFASVGNLNFWMIALVGAIGNTVGNVLLFEATRKKGLNYIKKFKLIPTKDIQKTEIAFRKKGAWFIFIGKLLPAIKVIVPIIAALGKMKTTFFSAIMLAASFIWATIFISIGYLFGKSTTVFKVYAPLLLIVAFAIMWLFYRYINSKEVLDELEK